MKRHFCLFLFLILLMGLLPLTAPARAAEIVDSGTCGDNLTWTLASDGVLTISGEGEMADGDHSLWESYSSEITAVILENGVTSIGDYAFSGCSGLTSVMIPGSVTSIGYQAFCNCTGLTSVTIPGSIADIGSAAFDGCTALNNIAIPRSVASIGSDAFSGCTGLTAVTVPESVLSAGFKNIFSGCGNLTAVTVADGVTAINDSAFSDCSGLTTVTIPNSVTSIGYSAFSGCTGLTSVTIPGSIADIGSAAFDGCTALNNIAIPRSVASIGSDAFSGCTGLTAVTVPESVLSAGFKNIFSGCGNLTAVTVADGVTAINDSAFSDCSGLTTVTIPNSVTSIGYSAFSGCTGLTSVTIPGSIADIGDSAFMGCSGLTAVTIPDSVISIGRYAFSDCSSMTAVFIGKGVATIGEGAFNGCNSLEIVDISDLNAWCSIAFESTSGGDSSYANPLNLAHMLYLNGTPVTRLTIPSGVTSIDANAFQGCDTLRSVSIPASVTAIGSGAFSGCTGITRVEIGDLAAWCAIDFGDNNANPLILAHRLYLNGSEITALGIPSGVTSIGKYAFSGCTGLTSVTVPDSVTAIGNSAFSGCTGLTSVTIPDSVFSIGRYAFSDCSGMTAVFIGKSVTTIGEGAFNGCCSLEKVDIADLAAWCAVAFSDFPSNPLVYAHQLYLNGSKVTDLIIPSGVSSIGNYAFSDCTGLTSVTIPSSVTSIGDRAFSGCAELTGITIPGSVASIGRDAFSDCRRLFCAGPIGSGCSFQYGWTVRIPKNAFSGLSSLISVAIPASVTNIQENAFSGCSGLRGIWYGGTEEEWLDVILFTGNDPLRSAELHYEYMIGDPIFLESGSCGDNLTYTLDQYGRMVVSGTGTFSPHPDLFNYSVIEVKSAVLGSGVTAIDDKAFSGCTSLTSVIIPDSVTSIGSYAFSGCTGLASIIIPDSVTYIGWATFEGCTGLANVEISDLAVWCAIDFSDKEANPLSLAHRLYLNGSEITALDIPSGVSSIGKYAFHGCTGLTSVTIPGSVTAIGDFAFGGCTGLTAVTIPRSVASIGSDAFSSCTGLTTVTVPQSVLSAGFQNIFSCCRNLTAVTVADGVTAINDSAFSGCSGLTTVTIPNSVTFIGNSAFYNCTSLTSVTIPDSITSIGSDAFSGCTSLTSVIIPDSVTSIGDYAFYLCSGLAKVEINDLAAWCAIDFGGTSGFSTCANPLSLSHHLYLNGSEVTALDIPSGVMRISEHAFSGCSSLTSVTIPDSVTSIDSYAFSGCSSLTSVAIPDSVTSIGSYAFSSCTGLTAVTVPESVCSAGFKNIFSGCRNLTTLTVADGVTFIGGGAFCNLSSLTSVTIPDSVTSIGDYAFEYCTSLTSVTIPHSVTYIGDYAFNNCSGLTAVTVPESVLSVRFKNIFSGCGNLTAVTVADGVTFIGGETFCNCSSLTSVTIPKSVTSIGYEAFCGCRGLTDVYYGGTAEDWDMISIQISNEPLTSANIHFTEPLTITGLKANKTGAAPGTAITWTATASGGSGTLKYYFLIYKDGTQIATRSYSTTRTFSYTLADAGTYKVKVYVKDEDGTKVHKTGAAVTIAVPPVITAQPSPKTVTSGKTAVFIVTASGTGLSYQWQYSKDGSTWTNKSGATAASYTVTAKASYNGLRYRCKVTNAGGSVYSNSAKLTVTASKPVITIQPADQMAAEGATVTFKIVASGTGLSYQWQYSKDASTWTNKSGATAASYTVTAKASYNGLRYRCKVTNAGGSVYSNSAKLTVTSSAAPVISSVKADKTAAAAGAKITWTATASGGTGTLQYYFILYKDGTKVKTRAYSTVNTFSYTPLEAGTYKVKVYVKDTVGNKVNKTSAAVTVILGPPAIISVKAGKTSSAVGEKITWTATAVGSEQPLKYYFILYKDGVKIKTRSYSTTNTFSYTPTEAGAYKVRVYVKDAADAKVNKLSAAVTVTG